MRDNARVVQEKIREPVTGTLESLGPDPFFQFGFVQLSQAAAPMRIRSKDYEQLSRRLGNQIESNSLFVSVEVAA